MPDRRQALQTRVGEELGRLRDAMVSIAKSIHANPEVGHREHASSRLLADFLECHGFEVTRGIAGMETSFLASFPTHARRPAVALLAEYDALPGLGHGCAHNLIGTACAGAAIGLSRAFPGLEGRIVVFGCPAEEAGIDGAGGKVHLVEQGCFKGVDAAISFHPMPMTTVGGETTALIGIDFEFAGKAAHAAGNPWDGINALDGVLQTFNAINALRQHVRPDVRIHGIVSHGGDAANIVPERAAARFFVRSKDTETLKETVEKVTNCARGAALATGTVLKTNVFNKLYESMRTNSVLAEIITQNLERVGFRVEGAKKGKGSTDFGNVTRVVPGCEVGLRLGKGIFPHTRAFLEASDSEEGYDVMMRGAEIMASSALDLLMSPDALAKAKQEFDSGPQ